MSYERDRLDILDLLGRNAHAYDSGDGECSDRLFVEDAEFVIEGRVRHVPSVMRDAMRSSRVSSPSGW